MRALNDLKENIKEEEKIKALEKGAKLSVVDDESLDGISDRMILVKDSLEALQKLAIYHREKLNIPFVGLTGSNGKTTTKNLIEKVLSSNYKVRATYGNLNNHIGVPLTVLSVTENDEIAIKVINGFIKSLAETLSDLALTFLPGEGIFLAGSLIRNLYKDINKDDFNKAFIGNRKDAHKNILDMISINVIMKERTPLYGNLKLFKTITKDCV